MIARIHCLTIHYSVNAIYMLLLHFWPFFTVRISGFYLQYGSKKCTLVWFDMGLQATSLPSIHARMNPAGGRTGIRELGAGVRSVQACNMIKSEQAIGSMPVITLYPPIMARRLSFKSPIMLSLKLFSSIPLYPFLFPCHSFTCSFTSSVPLSYPRGTCEKHNYISFFSFFRHKGYYKTAFKCVIRLWWKAILCRWH